MIFTARRSGLFDYVPLTSVAQTEQAVRRLLNIWIKARKLPMTVSICVLFRKDKYFAILYLNVLACILPSSVCKDKCQTLSVVDIYNFIPRVSPIFLQCFDTVGWVI